MYNNLPKVSPNGMTARTFLAFLTSAGLFYVNIMPTIVSGLIEALGFSNQQAGSIASANMYGAASGALFIVFLIKRLNWQLAATLFLSGLIVIDLLSIKLSDPTTLLYVRFLHGFIGGMLVGTGFALIARTSQPDRTFGVLLFVQFGFGGLGIMFIPGLVPKFGTQVLFYSLVAFSVATFLMLPFLSEYPVKPETDALNKDAGKGIRMWPFLLTLATIFLFQAALMGLFAFIIGLGEFYQLELGFISTTLGIANWLGLAGAGLVIIIGSRFGYLKSVIAGIVFTALAIWGLLYSNVPWIWVASNCLMGITWGFTISYLLGLASRFDVSGQMAAMGGFASKLGLASGPVVTAFLLGQDNYELIIMVATVAMLITLVTVWRPARLQDMLNRAENGV
jgi:DHA1 family inner membrane transport protein